MPPVAKPEHSTFLELSDLIRSLPLAVLTRAKSESPNYSKLKGMITNEYSNACY